jgi:hypothetical protein
MRLKVTKTLPFSLELFHGHTQNCEPKLAEFSDAYLRLLQKKTMGFGVF